MNPTRLALAALVACLIAGCSSDDSMSGTVKPNPEMSKRYQKPADLSAQPKGPSGGPGSTK